MVEEGTIPYRCRSPQKTVGVSTTEKWNSFRADMNVIKLESLCRELQKHSKAVVGESRLRAKEEEQRENFQYNERLQLENNELSVKLQGLAEQYEKRKGFEKQQSLRTMTSRRRGIMDVCDASLRIIIINVHVCIT